MFPGTMGNNVEDSNLHS